MGRKPTKLPGKSANSAKPEDSKPYRGTQPTTAEGSSGTAHGFSKVDADEEIPFSGPEVGRQQSLTPREAEAALRDLFESGTDPDNPNVAADDTDSIVPGFIALSTKKRAGGILADDMGLSLGKTIQLLARVVDGPISKRDRELGWSKTTLVVCPLALISQWEAESTKFTPGLKVIPYHGPVRNKLDRLLADADIVLTTYGIVCSEHSNSEAGKGSVLFTIEWGRIVLDEAHTIKNRKTKTSEACCNLSAKFRWCLTATPMQNEVEDFYPLMKLLRIKPLNDWDQFNLQVAKPIKKGAGASLAMRRLQVVLKHVMFRRTKAQLVAYLRLPERSVHFIACKFDPVEERFYTLLKADAKSLLRKILAQSDQGGVYMCILVLILRLRQACDHPCLILDSAYADDADSDDFAPGLATAPTFEDTDFEDETRAPECKLCMSPLTGQNSAANEWPGHCINCAALKVQAQNLRKPTCASTKIRTIVQLLRKIATSGNQEKTVIFSQFTSMLDVIEPFVSAIGLDFVRYDGKMSPKERKEALSEIEKNPRKTVILVSLKAGGVGLNLTACNHVILVDMWWNPAVEGHTIPSSIFRADHTPGTSLRQNPSCRTNTRCPHLQAQNKWHCRG
ncbi:SNF2 family N-terminal domain-containing protein [Mycena crocata]|nr:SNF2 family N-terminal domain-containing protein [Mycena crocata]